jgi:hypothetical protein
MYNQPDYQYADSLARYSEGLLLNIVGSLNKGDIIHLVSYHKDFLVDINVKR